MSQFKSIGVSHISVGASTSRRDRNHKRQRQKIARAPEGDERDH
jgi:hypothetical protein